MDIWECGENVWQQIKLTSPTRIYWRKSQLERIGVDRMRKFLSMAWYYTTLPIYWFLILITSPSLAHFSYIASGISFVLFIFTLHSTSYWLGMCVFFALMGVGLSICRVFYGVVGELLIGFINSIQRLIDGTTNE